MSKYCPTCGYDNRDTAAFCATCRSQLPVGSGGSMPPGPPALPGASMMGAGPQASLVVGGQRFAVQSGVTLIGRSPACHIVLGDPSVSTNHAEISWDGAQYLVRDLGSTNGTWVNRSQVIAATPLAPGAQLFFGTMGFTFDLAGAAGTSQPSSPGGTQAISPQQIQRRIGQGAAAAAGATRGKPRVSGKILSEPIERQEQPPPDPARTLVMLAVVVFFLGMLCSFIAMLLTVGIVLLICGGAALLFIVPFLWMPIQMGFSGVMNRLRDEKPVSAVSFQVQDDATGQVFDVGFVRKSGVGGGGLHLGDKVEVWGKQQGGNQVQASKIRVFESHGVATSVLVPIRKGWPIAVGILALVAVVAAIVAVAAALGILPLPHL